jgi:hypothetical protein
MKKRLQVVVAIVAAALMSTPATARAADAVLDWNAIAIAAGAPSPFHQARIMAITQLAVFEAVNAIEGGYQPYLGSLSVPAGASSSAAAIAAAHRVLKHYLPGRAVMLDDARAASLAAIPDGSAKDGGVATGEAAADAMIAARVDDGSAPAQFSLPDSTDPGVWQPTPTCSPAGGNFLQWREITPFGIANAADFYATPPPALSSNAYAKDFDEVKRVGRKVTSERPQDRTDVARFYAAASPAYVMNLAARQVATAQGHSMVQNARSLALINMAINDSLIASFGTKYQYNLWRPETAVRANPTTTEDNSWEPLIPTPCFPAYVSNHASGSYGGAEMLRRLYGGEGHAITITNASFPALVYQYTQFKEITADIDDARVYGGIHFRFDQEGGARLGRNVATAVYRGNLRPVTPE